MLLSFAFRFDVFAFHASITRNALQVASSCSCLCWSRSSLASVYLYIWKRRARRIATVVYTTIPPAQHIQNRYSSINSDILVCCSQKGLNESMISTWYTISSRDEGCICFVFYIELSYWISCDRWPVVSQWPADCFLDSERRRRPNKPTYDTRSSM